jgi:hypothetical protein
MNEVELHNEIDKDKKRSLRHLPLTLRSRNEWRLPKRSPKKRRRKEGSKGRGWRQNRGHAGLIPEPDIIGLKRQPQNNLYFFQLLYFYLVTFI